MAAYRAMPEEELFVLTPVRLIVPEENLPGRSVSRVMCEACAEGVNDCREVRVNGRVLCRACALGSYYSPLPVLQQGRRAPSPTTGG